MKKYFMIVVLIISIVLLIGFALPFLFSQPDWMAVGLGIVVCVLSVIKLNK